LTVVENIRPTPRSVPVYNLRIADWHTYFVGSEEWGFSVWAHNTGECTPARPNKLKPIIEGISKPGRFNATVDSLDEALQAVQAAMPDAIQLPDAVPGQPYPKPPPGTQQWYQVHPPEPSVGNNKPHIKYGDWTGGKKGTGGSWGHIFFTP